MLAYEGNTEAESQDDAASGNLRAAARRIGEDVPTAVKLARRVGERLPLPGRGDTARRWAALAELAEGSLTVARVAEPHVDALAILSEADQLVPGVRDLSWGVFAAEAPGHRLVADVGRDGSAMLSGIKPWCSLAAQLDAALVTAHVGSRRQLFRVDLRAEGVCVQPSAGWVARGLRAVTSVAVSFDDVPAVAVGEPEWYLNRPGFAWGGIGVAACWYGAARALYAAMLARARRAPR